MLVIFKSILVINLKYFLIFHTCFHNIFQSKPIDDMIQPMKFTLLFLCLRIYLVTIFSWFILVNPANPFVYRVSSFTWNNIQTIPGSNSVSPSIFFLLKRTSCHTICLILSWCMEFLWLWLLRHIHGFWSPYPPRLERTKVNGNLI